MAETNWTFFGADAATIKRVVSAGFTPPNGGGSFVLGFNALKAAVDAVGMYNNTALYAPLTDDGGFATGGEVAGCLVRPVGMYQTGFAIGLFLNLQAATKTDIGYVLALSDNYPYNIVLAKGTIANGYAAASTAILRSSTQSYTPGTWHQLKLGSIVNPNGDVILQCWENDLSANPCSAPAWTPIVGLEDFVDDALGINAAATGLTSPLAGGYGGAFFSTTGLGRWGLVDQLQLDRAK